MKVVGSEEGSGAVGVMMMGAGGRESFCEEARGKERKREEEGEVSELND